MRIAKQCQPGRLYHCGYYPRHDWGENDYLQWGEIGDYCFFEAFPQEPDTYIRTESKTSLEDAEGAAFLKLDRYKDCKEHEFERRHYRNGVGICKHCGLFKSKAFEPLEKCFVCEKPTYFGTDKDENWYCETHYLELPDEKLHPILLRMKKDRESNDKVEISEESLKDSLKVILNALSEEDCD